MDQARAMLDALMGPQRDVEKKRKRNPAEDWKDESVCRSFLCGFCPFDKEVLGGMRNIKVCPKIHSEAIRACFDKHQDGVKDSALRLDFEAEAMQGCEELMQRAEEHSAKEVERLRSEIQKTKPKLPQETLLKLEELRVEAADIERRAGLLMKDAKTGGGYKNLSLTWSRAAKEKLEEAEELEKSEQKRIADSIQPKSCEVCGTVTLDEAKFQAHFHFDVHEGYKLVRDRHAQLEARQRQRQKDQSRERSRSERARSPTGPEAYDDRREARSLSRSRQAGSQRRFPERDVSGGRDRRRDYEDRPPRSRRDAYNGDRGIRRR